MAWAAFSITLVSGILEGDTGPTHPLLGRGGCVLGDRDSAPSQKQARL